MEQKDQRSDARPLLLIGILIALLFPVGALAYVLLTHYRLRRASKPGREATPRLTPDGFPLTTLTRDGTEGDPINLQFCATDGQIGLTFAHAGWYRADEIDLITSIRISIDSILARKYSTAPVSDLFLFGRKEDLAFERPGSSVRVRDHLRLWKTTITCDHDRPIWIGSATKDIKVELSKTNYLPTHGISPDIDAERSLVVSELAQTGFVISETTRPGFGKETHGFNGGGDPYFTDGQVAVLTLANVFTTPLATQIRHPLTVRIVQFLSRFIHYNLPQAGLDRATREKERIAAQSK
jgi:hypothetical protein